MLYLCTVKTSERVAPSNSELRTQHIVPANAERLIVARRDTMALPHSGDGDNKRLLILVVKQLKFKERKTQLWQ